MGGDIPDRIESFIDMRSRTHELYEIKALRGTSKSESMNYGVNATKTRE
jgi:hypothetical protein